MARICNDERVRFGVVSGHGRKTLRLSVDAGRSLGSAQGDSFRAHDHDVVNNVGGSATYSVQLQHAQVTGAGQGDELVVSGAILPRGGPETRPRNIALAFCIRT